MKTPHIIIDLKELGMLVREWARHMKKEYPLAFPLFLQIFTQNGFEKISEALVDTEREKIADKIMEYLFAQRVRDVTREMFLENSPEEILRYFQDALKFHNAGLVTKAKNAEKSAPVKPVQEKPVAEISEEQSKALSSLFPLLFIAAQENEKRLEEERLREIRERLKKLAEEREAFIKSRNAELAYLIEYPVKSGLSQVRSFLFQYGHVD